MYVFKIAIATYKQQVKLHGKEMIIILPSVAISPL